MSPLTPEISTLINTPDAVEVVRDRIAEILSVEIARQKQMAEAAGLPAADFDIEVAVENRRPYEAAGGETPKRWMNVLLAQAEPKPGNSGIGGQKTKATFLVDCVAVAGGAADDKRAAKRAWKMMRLARAILTSSPYAYLGMRGLVTDRAVTLMRTMVNLRTGWDDPQTRSALASVVAQMTLEVEYEERFIDSDGPEIEPPEAVVEYEGNQIPA